MLKRSWFHRWKSFFGWAFVGLLCSSISEAKPWLTVRYNEFNLGSEPFTLVKIEVDPEILRNQLSSPAEDRLFSIQDSQKAYQMIDLIEDTQEQYEVIETLLNEKQDFIAENYKLHGQDHEIAYGAAYKFPDPTGEHQIMVQSGNIRAKTKVDDFLQRKSVTIMVIRGHDLRQDLQTKGAIRKKMAATVMAVESDKVRALKDFAELVPNSTFQEILASQKTPSNFHEFEFENLAVAKTPEGAIQYEYIPFLMNQLFISRAIAGPSAVGEWVLIRIGSMPQGSLAYSGWGFVKYAERAALGNAPAMDYFFGESMALEKSIATFYSVKTEEEFLSLRTIQKVKESYSEDELLSAAKLVAKKAAKPRFEPVIETMNRFFLNCKDPLHDQLTDLSE